MYESSLPPKLQHMIVPRSNSERVPIFMQRGLVREEERQVAKKYEVDRINSGTLVHTKTTHSGLTIDENLFPIREEEIVCNYLHFFDAEGRFVNAYFESDNMIIPPQGIMPSLFVRLLTYPTQLFSGNNILVSGHVENYVNGYTHLFCSQKTAKSNEFKPMHNLRIFLDYDSALQKLVMTSQAQLGADIIIGKVIKFEAMHNPVDNISPKFEWIITRNNERRSETFYSRWMREKMLFQERRARYIAEFLK